jgi:hypothetical protein
LLSEFDNSHAMPLAVPAHPQRNSMETAAINRSLVLEVLAVDGKEGLEGMACVLLLGDCGLGYEAAELEFSGVGSAGCEDGTTGGVSDTFERDDGSCLAGVVEPGGIGFGAAVGVGWACENTCGGLVFGAAVGVNWVVGVEPGGVGFRTAVDAGRACPGTDDGVELTVGAGVPDDGISTFCTIEPVNIN